MPTLQELKKQRNLTNAQLGRAIGCSASVAGMVLQGRYIHVYHDSDIQRLADALHITFERCWYAMCESYNAFMKTPGAVHQRADEIRYEVQVELREQTQLPIPIEEPRPLAMIDAVVMLPSPHLTEGKRGEHS